VIDPTCSVASWFLWCASVLFLVVLALPLLLAPLGWARKVGWRIPEQTELTVYFGRCLGALGLAIVLTGMEAAPHPRAHAILFDLIVAAGALLALVHVWGALRREQPWLETAEIAVYLGLTALTWWIRRGL
jgi:hypothetical protein